MQLKALSFVFDDAVVAIDDVEAEVIALLRFIPFTVAIAIVYINFISTTTAAAAAVAVDDAAVSAATEVALLLISHQLLLFSLHPIAASSLYFRSLLMDAPSLLHGFLAHHSSPFIWHFDLLLSGASRN